MAKPLCIMNLHLNNEGQERPIHFNVIEHKQIIYMVSHSTLQLIFAGNYQLLTFDAASPRILSMM
jgi:hypothetical protein